MEARLRNERRIAPAWKVALIALLVMGCGALYVLFGTKEPIKANPRLPAATYVVGGPPMTTILRLELADTPERQRRGLMARDSLPEQGMAFPWNGRPANFWMRGTGMPLDIVYVGTDGRVESVTRAEAFDEKGVQSKGDVSLVIEVPAGRARLYGLKPGVEVRPAEKVGD